jgi:hypothetical protein
MCVPKNVNMIIGRFSMIMHLTKWNSAIYRSSLPISSSSTTDQCGVYSVNTRQYTFSHPSSCYCLHLFCNILSFVSGVADGGKSEADVPETPGDDKLSFKIPSIGPQVLPRCDNIAFMGINDRSNVLFKLL